MVMSWSDPVDGPAHPTASTCRPQACFANCSRWRSQGDLLTWLGTRESLGLESQRWAAPSAARTLNFCEWRIPLHWLWWRCIRNNWRRRWSVDWTGNHAHLVGRESNLLAVALHQCAFRLLCRFYPQCPASYYASSNWHTFNQARLLSPWDENEMWQKCCFF